MLQRKISRFVIFRQKLKFSYFILIQIISINLLSSRDHFFFISNIYIHIPGFTFTLINYGKISCFIATNGSCQPITSTKRTKMIFLLVELKGMLHHQYRRVKNFITWYHITITLCLVFNSTSRKFHGFGVPIIG
jgi:hypothetical protein